ncbi:MAG TPA: M20 family metallopeptidase [Thermomicrobiales bacterium]|nr:M20 family metallopeptidase [Thermomicrobiales bacterium]
MIDPLSRDAIVALAQELIRIPSVSGDEQAIMSWVQGWAAQNGIDCQIIATDPVRPNLILSVGNSDSGPVLCMNGHLDTVPVSDPDSWRTGPFAAAISEDATKLTGRGASDMKASVAVMLSTLLEFRDKPLAGLLQGHIVSDEELSGAVGTIAVIEAIKDGKLVRPDWCLIGEKSDLKVRNAERGILAVEVIVHGRASHTAAARVTGINAIMLAAKAIIALEHDLDRFHPSVGKPVISINMISAGVAHNVVPGECRFSIDRRLIPGETRESVVAEIEAILQDLTRDEPRFRYTLVIDPSGDFIPANITAEKSRLVQTMNAAVRTVLKREPEYFVQWAGATDGRYYRQIGIDTVGFGPGGEGAHGANEAVLIDDLVAQANVYRETVQQLLGVAQ